jgi:hypothetical protein
MPHDLWECEADTSSDDQADRGDDEFPAVGLQSRKKSAEWFWGAELARTRRVWRQRIVTA